jgi:hypothetical protein
MPDDIVTQAAAVLAPLLSAGAGAAATSAGKQMGGELATKARHVLSRLKLREGRRDQDYVISRDELTEALRAAVHERVLDLADLRQIVRLSRDTAVHNEFTGGRARTVIQTGTMSVGDLRFSSDDD